MKKKQMVTLGVAALLVAPSVTPLVAYGEVLQPRTTETSASVETSEAKVETAQTTSSQKEETAVETSETAESPAPIEAANSDTTDTVSSESPAVTAESEAVISSEVLSEAEEFALFMYMLWPDFFYDYDYYLSKEAEFTPGSFLVYQTAVAEFKTAYDTWVNAYDQQQSDAKELAEVLYEAYLATELAFSSLVVVTPSFDTSELVSLLTDIDTLALWDADYNYHPDYAPWSIEVVMTAYDQAESLLSDYNNGALVLESEYNERVADVKKALSRLVPAVETTTVPVTLEVTKNATEEEEFVLVEKEVVTPDGTLRLRLMDSYVAQAGYLRLEIYLGYQLIVTDLINEEGLFIGADNLSAGYNEFSGNDFSATVKNFTTDLEIQLIDHRDNQIVQQQAHVTADHTPENPLVIQEAGSGEQDTAITAYYASLDLSDGVAENLTTAYQANGLSETEIDAELGRLNEEHVLEFAVINYYSGDSLLEQTFAFSEEVVRFMTVQNGVSSQLDVTFTVGEISDGRKGNLVILDSLEAAISLAEGLNQQLYTESSWQTLEMSLVNAKDVYQTAVKQNAALEAGENLASYLTQVGVDSATTRLLTSIEALELKTAEDDSTKEKEQATVMPSLVPPADSGNQQKKLPKTNERQSGAGFWGFSLIGLSGTLLLKRRRQHGKN